MRLDGKLLLIAGIVATAMLLEAAIIVFVMPAKTRGGDYRPSITTSR